MSNNAGNMLIALIGGAAIGAGLGILFAPDKGTRTREKIKDGYKDAQRDLKCKFDELTSEMKYKLKNSKLDLEESYEELISDVSHKTEDVISFLEMKLAELKEQNAKLQK